MAIQTQSLQGKSQTYNKKVSAATSTLNVLLLNKQVLNKFYNIIASGLYNYLM